MLQRIVIAVLLAHMTMCLMAQGNADQLAMFSGMRGWTPPRGWIVRGGAQSLCGVGNLVCMVDSQGAPLNEILLELREVSHW